MLFPGLNPRTDRLVANRYSAYAVQALRRFGKARLITTHSATSETVNVNVKPRRNGLTLPLVHILGLR